MYDVIDGKQRLETILVFLHQGRFSCDGFAAKLELDGETGWFDWAALKRHYPDVRNAFETDKVQRAEVKDELP